MKTNQKSFGLALFLAGLFGLLMLAACLRYYFRVFEAPDTPEKAGAFGDFLGGILNPIFGLMGFIALLYTVYLQKRQLVDQANESRLNGFDSHFFRLLDGADAAKKGVSEKGTQYFGEEALYQIVWKVRDEIAGPQPGKELADEAKRISGDLVERFDKVYKARFFHADVYFRAWYHLFAYIFNSRLQPSEQHWYVNFARSQLSNFALALLYCNGLTPRGRNFKLLVEYYGLLKHLDPEVLGVTLDVIKLGYSPTAYMDAAQRWKYWEAHKNELDSLLREISDVRPPNYETLWLPWALR